MISKYILDLRHRPRLDDSVEVRNTRFLARQADLKLPWRLPTDGTISGTISPGKLSSIVNLNKVLGQGLKGQIVYQLRKQNYLRDLAQFDDTFSIEFDPRNVDYKSLITQAFPALVNAFECYRATIYSKSLARHDWRDIIRLTRSTSSDVNGRDGIYRINAVNFFDRDLCNRAFGLDPEQIVRRLDGRVEKVMEFSNGVLLVVSSDVLDEAKIGLIDTRVRGYLV